MRVKKFYANSMPEAMATIRAELGPEAVILHSEEKRRGGLFGWFQRPKLEITAAIDTDLQDFPRPTPAINGDIQKLRHEMAALKIAMTQVTDSQKQAAKTESRVSSGRAVLPRIASLDAWYNRLLEQGVGTQLAQQIIQAVADELSRWALDNESVLNEHLHWHLGRRLAAPTPITITPGRPRVFFVVGPTGVGKTTTMAKLAANFSRLQKARVIMITADTFRVAAIPQLKAFGEILGLPVEVAYKPQQLADLVQASSHYDLIMVDTPGRSQRATREVNELNDYLAVVPRKTVHLAISAGTQYQDMKKIVETFGMMALNGFIFTKTDETMSLGPAYTLACETGIPMSYLTTGQKVPEDIEIASAERVIDMMVGPVADDIRSIKTGQLFKNGK